MTHWQCQITGTHKWVKYFCHHREYNGDLGITFWSTVAKFCERCKEPAPGWVGHCEMIRADSVERVQ